MGWDDRLEGFFEDLEQQADGLALGERDAEVAESRPAEYARVDLAARLHGSVGLRLRLVLQGVGALDGTLRRAGAGWLLLDAGTGEWIVAVPALQSLRGLGERGVAEAARPVTARLGLGSVLRRVAGSRSPAVLHRRDGTLVRGTLGRVGSDFVEVRGEGDPDGSVEVLPFAALAAVSGARSS